jgi:translocation and assembly module TamA
MISSFFRKCFLLPLFFCTLLQAAATESYDVQIEGVTDTSLLNNLHSSSQLIHLDKYTPDTPAALRRRAEADIPHFLKVLHSQAYYNAKISLEVEQSSTPPLVRFTINLGPVYPIERFTILAAEGTNEPIPYYAIPLNELDIILGQPALPDKIVCAEEALLDYMMHKGYPLAKIITRDTVADQKKKTIAITLHLDSGPSALFGETVITGNKSVNPQFVENKIAWIKGKTFTPDKVALTQEALEASGLFSSISINYPEATLDGNELPMEIQLTECKHRSIGAGISYATQRGPGGTF